MTSSCRSILRHRFVLWLWSGMIAFAGLALFANGIAAQTNTDTQNTVSFEASGDAVVQTSGDALAQTSGDATVPPFKQGLIKEGEHYHYYDNGVMTKRSWVSMGEHKYYFDKQGNALTLSQKVEGVYYVFNRKGQLLQPKKTGKIKLAGETYMVAPSGKAVSMMAKNYEFYYHKDGRMAVGLTKINGGWFFYSKKGALKKGTVTDGKWTYYTNEWGCIEVCKKGKTYYYPNQKRKLSKDEAYEYETLLKARSIVKKITNDNMTKSQKINACFRYVMNKYYAIHRKFPYQNAYWPAIYANDHYANKGGDCHADASAFAYLVYALGYRDVYVCNDSKGNVRYGGHSWAEVDGRVYDPLFAQARGFSKYYGVSYRGYGLRPVLHIKIAPKVLEKPAKKAKQNRTGQ